MARKVLPERIAGFIESMECHHPSGAKHRARTRRRCQRRPSPSPHSRSTLIPQWFPHSNRKVPLQQPARADFYLSR